MTPVAIQIKLLRKNNSAKPFSFPHTLKTTPYVQKHPHQTLSTSINFSVFYFFILQDPVGIINITMTTYNISSFSSRNTTVIEFSRATMQAKVLAYKNVQLALTDDAVAQKYANVLTSIDNLADRGQTSYSVTLSENDLATLIPLLEKNDFTVTTQTPSNLSSRGNQFFGTLGAVSGAASSLTNPNFGPVYSGSTITVSWD